MKKSKLIVTFCTLILSLACLAFGVYSAVKTSFTASGTITFNAYGINLDIDMSFAGTETAIGNKYVSTHKDRSEHLTSGQTYTDISTGVTGIALAFDELTVPEGKTEPELKITMTLNVKNYSGFAIMAIPTLKFGASGAETTETFDSTFISTVTNKVVNLADQDTAAITISITPKNTATAITSNNNFKFEFEFAPYNYTSYYTSQGYTLLEDGKGNIKISNGKLSGKYTGTDTKVIIPEGVTSIGDSAFYNCSKLTAVAIPEGVTSISFSAFSGCSKLTSITIPSSITSIIYSAFKGCNKLTYITIGNAKYLTDSAGNPTVLVKATSNSITFCDIAATTKVIYYQAFLGCRCLTSITIPEGVTDIVSSAFFECYALAEVYNLSSIITITKGSTDNGNLAHYVQDEDAIYTSLDIPSRISEENGVKYYTNGSKVVALTAANKLIESISIRQDCTAINQSAFIYCGKLTTITIPSSVTSIGSSAFYSCSKLTYTTIGNAKYLTDSAGNPTVLVKATSTSITSCDIADTTKIIYGSAFSNCSSLTTITIPEGVISIGSSAFNYCSKLTSITMPSSVTSIGKNAFSSCTNLATITCNSENVGTESIGRSLYFTPTGGTKTTSTVSTWQTGTGVYTKS